MRGWVAVAGICLLVAGCGLVTSGDAATVGPSEAPGAPATNCVLPNGASSELPQPVVAHDDDGELAARLAETWGIRIESVRLTALGRMVDFRFRVLDTEKALPLFDRATKAYLVLPESGTKLVVPRPAKVGLMRQTLDAGSRPKEGRVYFMLFGNAGKYVLAGDEVTIEIGGFRVDHLKVLG